MKWRKKKNFRKMVKRGRKQKHDRLFSTHTRQPLHRGQSPCENILHNTTIYHFCQACQTERGQGSFFFVFLFPDWCTLLKRALSVSRGINSQSCLSTSIFHYLTVVFDHILPNNFVYTYRPRQAGESNNWSVFWDICLFS